MKAIIYFIYLFFLVKTLKENKETVVHDWRQNIFYMNDEERVKNHDEILPVCYSICKLLQKQVHVLIKIKSTHIIFNNNDCYQCQPYIDQLLK